MRRTQSTKVLGAFSMHGLRSLFRSILRQRALHRLYCRLRTRIMAEMRKKMFDGVVQTIAWLILLLARAQNKQHGLSFANRQLFLARLVRQRAPPAA